MTSSIVNTFNNTAGTWLATDNTNYVTTYGLSLTTNLVKLYGTLLGPDGTSILWQKNSAGSPLINLQSGATTSTLALPTNSDGDIASGTYAVSTQVRAVFLIGAYLVNNPNGILITGGADLAASIVEGMEITISGATNPANNGTFTVVEATSVSGFIAIELEETIIVGAGDGGVAEIIFETFSDTYTYTGCDEVTQALTITADCNYGDFGSFIAAESTELDDQIITTSTMTIYYPSWTEEANVVVTQTTPDTPISKTILRLATGAYTVKVVSVYADTQDDGLVVTYTQTITQEHEVSCAGSFCCAMTCFGTLLTAHLNSLRTNRGISAYQYSYDAALGYYAQASAYKDCADKQAEFQTAMDAFTAALDASGTCDCGTSCDEDLRWVVNGSTDTINAITALQAAVLALQNPTIYQIPIFDSILPVCTDDSIFTNAPENFRPFTDVSAITIDKDYLTPGEDGYPTKWVEIELIGYMNSASPAWALAMKNADTDLDILPTGFSVAIAEGAVKYKIKLCAWQADDDNLLRIVQVEGMGVDVDDSLPLLKQYKQRSSLTLWDTEEDLVLDFTPTDATAVAFSSLRITAFGIA